MDRGFNINQGEMPTGSLSNLSYKTVGTKGSRILKIEWRNVGFYNEIADDNTSTDYMNFQIWLYEIGKIEMHVGPSLITQPELSYNGIDGATTMLYSAFDHTDEFSTGVMYGMEGAPTNPTWVVFEDGEQLPTLAANMPNGIVYSFSQESADVAGLQSIDNNAISLYPVPTQNELNFTLNNDQVVLQVQIVNQNGQVVQALADNTSNVSALPAGIYFLQIQTEQGMITKKWLKV